MKKATKLLLAFMLFFIIFATVSAKEEVFKYDWEKDTKKIYEMSYNQNMSYKEGYIVYNVTGTESPITEITYYNYKGEEIVSKSIDSVIFGYTFIVDDYIYVILSDYDNDYQVSIVKYNDKLVEEERIDLDTELSDSIGSHMFYYFYHMKLSGINPISTIDNKIHLVANGVLVHFDKDLTELTYEELTSENAEVIMKKYYPELYEMETNIDLTDLMVQLTSYDIKDENKVISGLNSNCKGKAAECLRWGVITLLDKDNEVVWSKELDDYDMIINVKFADNYIVAMGYIINDYDDIDSDILILDMEGNIVQTISSNGRTFQSLNISKYGFMTNKTSGTCNILESVSEEGISDVSEPALAEVASPQCRVVPVTYYLPRAIETKVIGSGKINVVNTARNGEEITYEIIPDKGYVLGVVKITDRDGNVVEYTSNKFTMPASDVTMEVTFLPENPETTDAAIVTFVVIFIAGLFCTITNYKKLKFLK